MLTRYGLYVTSHQTGSVIYAIQVIELDPSSHRGYEAKHAALHGMGHYSEAFEEFRVMLSKLDQSLDPQIRGKLFYQYWRQQKNLIGFGQSSVMTMWTQLRRFEMWSSRLSAACHVCSSTLLPAVSMTRLNRQQLSRNSQSTTSCDLQ